MIKKIAALFLTVVMVLSMGISTVLAVDVATGTSTDSRSRVCIGADLTEAERAQIYKDFGLKPGDVPELQVHIEDEHATLDHTDAKDKIGRKSISCVYVAVKDAGGIFITCNNINWCTAEMYVNALTTAGIENAEIRVSAPFAVSGTAALTGIYKAYEDVTGVLLDDIAKQIAASELVTTAELADYLGSANATDLINQLKAALEETKKMSDDELRDYIKQVATDQKVELTDAQVTQIFDLIRQLETVDIDTNEWAAKLDNIKNSLSGVNTAAEKVTGFFTKIGDFFTGIFDWIGDLFSGGKK